MSCYYVYILRSSNDKYYVGYTTNLNRRMKQHQNGTGSKFIRGFGFGKLLYHETYPTKSEALKREAHLKGWSRAEKEALLNTRRPQLICPSGWGSTKPPV